MSEQQQLLQNETSGEMVLLSDQTVFALLGQVDDFLTWVPPAAAQRGCMVGIYQPTPAGNVVVVVAATGRNPNGLSLSEPLPSTFLCIKTRKGEKKGDFLLVSCIPAWLLLVVGLTVLNRRLCA